MIGDLERVIDASPEGRLGELFRRHSSAAIRLAYLLTGSRAVAEDLVQDAFIRVFVRFQDLRSPDAFEAYLRKTVVNLVRNHFRRLGRERAYAAREAELRARVEASSDVEARDEMLEALRSLPLRQRTAVVLRYYRDLSEQQTADVMGCSVGAVKSYVSRGLVSLRGRLEGVER